MLVVPPSRSFARRGAVLVKLLMCLAVLIGMLALNLDGGRLMDERRRAQTIADAAALAAADQLYRQWWDRQGEDDGSARSAAIAVTTANGIPASMVEVNIPPRSGPHAGQLEFAEVLIRADVEASFSRVFHGGDLVVSARAIARGRPLPIGIICLQPDGANAFRNSAAAFAVVNKPVIVNSTDPDAFIQSGLAFVAGNVQVSGGTNFAGSLISLTRVYRNMPPTLDPLAYLPVPSGGVLRSATPRTIDSLLPVILQPGIYRGGLHITGISTVIMSPGVYIMDGGGFRVDGAATVTGLFTMVYTTAGQISITGLGKVVMTAPLSGTYQGINFFQHRGHPAPITVRGLGLTTITGVIYGASAPAVVEGVANVGLDILGGAYVVDSLTIGGVGAVTLNLGLNPPRVPDVRLVD